MLKILLFCLVLVFTSCGIGQPNPTYVYNTNPNYTWGFADFYGAYYANYNKNNVISLSLFSDSLKIDDLGNLTGVGQSLFLEDVFVEPKDTLLPVGTYSVNNTGLPFTVSSGRNDTIDNVIYPIGARISYYELNAAKSKMQLISSGSFTVTQSGSVYNIVCDFKTTDSILLKGTFSAKLPTYNQSIVVPKSVRRNNLVYLK